jgi:hypothetical protein
VCSGASGKRRAAQPHRDLRKEIGAALRAYRIFQWRTKKCVVSCGKNEKYNKNVPNIVPSVDRISSLGSTRLLSFTREWPLSDPPLYFGRISGFNQILE